MNFIYWTLRIYRIYYRFQRNYENLWFCSPKLNVHDIGGWMYWVTFLIADRLLVAQSVRADRAAESSQNCPELEILKMLSEILYFFNTKNFSVIFLAMSVSKSLSFMFFAFRAFAFMFYFSFWISNKKRLILLIGIKNDWGCRILISFLVNLS